MASFQPVRDAAGGIVGLRPRDDEQPTMFGALLAETLAAVGVETASAPEGRNTPARAVSGRQYAAIGAILLLMALAMGSLTGQSAAHPPALAPTDRQPPATAAPVVVHPQIAPTPGPVAVVAWAAPDGAVLGPIVAPAHPLARYGDAWLQVAWQNGKVWVRARDLPGIDAAALASLPDLAPPTALPAVAMPAAADSAATPVPTEGHNHERPALDRSPAATPVMRWTVR
jgi:hypothetical protein